MIIPKKIIRTNRRSLAITINNDGELIVKAPKKLSMNYIYSFIESKEKWIVQKQKVIQNSNFVNLDIINYKEYLLFGKKYEKITINKLKQIEISEEKIFFPSNIELYDEFIMSINWYSKITKEIVKKRVEYFSDLMQLNYNSIKIDNLKNKWGSCDINGNLKFNLRVAMLPHKVIDYIVIHELSHLVEFNHSKNFYLVIEQVMPDYKIYRTNLKQYDFLLKLFR